MTKALTALPSHVRGQLADALEMGMLQPDCSALALTSTTGLRDGADEVCAALKQLAAMGLSGEACGAWLRALGDLEGQTRKPDVVWSGPNLQGLHARQTGAVYEELFATAQRSLWVSSYAYFDGKEAFKALSARMDACPELQCHLLLNIQRKWGDKTPGDDLILNFARKLWNEEWPGTRRPKVFYDPRSLELPYRDGVLHAKAVVVDNEVLFVTSANLTAMALKDNIELGLLHRDPALAKNVAAHFHELISQERLKPLPAV